LVQVKEKYTAWITTLVKETTQLLKYTVKIANFLRIKNSTQQTLTKSVLGRKDDMVFTIDHINESEILLFYNTGELKHIQTDNNNMKTLGKINKSQGGNIKRLFGRMFKLNNARDTVYWKKSNNEIVK
jgi:hypothetical protein